MGRLGVLIVLLAIVVAAAVVVQLRVAPEVALPPMAKEAMAAENLSKRDQARLKVLQDKFVKERDAFLQMRAAGTTGDKLEAQQKKANDAAQAVTELGGQNALKAVGKSKYAPASSEQPGAKGGDPSSKAAASSCSGEAGGSCSDGGTCTPSSAEKAPSKDAKAGESAKPEAAAKPAAPAKPAPK